MTIQPYMDKKLKISSTLSKLLEENNTSLRKLSDHCNIPLSSISEWKTNNRNPNAEDLAKVANYFGCSIHYLLFGEEDPAEPIQKVQKLDFFSGIFEISIKRVKVKQDE